MSDNSEIKHFHMYCGSGSGAAGFSDARPEIPGLQGKMVCIGGIDVDAAGAKDFYMLNGVACTVRDLFSRGQYLKWHGQEPPAGWVEAMPADVRAAAQHQRPDIVFLSAPCKGFSGLLPAAHANTARYQALNELTLRGVWLMLEAWANDPVPVILFENVPRIATRGRHLLDQITSMLRHYGYIVRETTHDCGELGGLAQSRKRFLLIARHAEKMPAFIYEPPKRPLRGVGEILGRMRLPGDLAAGPMHRIPSLSWKTWVRLAFVEAGSDWRSLNKLAVENGHLRDYLIVPNYHAGYCGVHRWEDSTGTIAGRNSPTNGAFSTADPRFHPSSAWKDGQAYGVRRWGDSTGTIAGQQGPGQGAYSIADLRHHGPAKHSNEFRIVRYDAAARAVTGAHGSGQCVADPAPGMQRRQGDAYLTGGHYGVVDWGQYSGAVSASACHDNGRWSIADPRPMPAPDDRLVCRITALDGTWHRPFTTLELAALQSFFDPDDYAEAGADPFVLFGTSDQAWRERIGNAVPRRTARKIAEEIGRAILLARTGETFQLSSTPIWVRPIATALAVRGNES